MSLIFPPSKRAWSFIWTNLSPFVQGWFNPFVQGWFVQSLVKSAKGFWRKLKCEKSSQTNGQTDYTADANQKNSQAFSSAWVRWAYNHQNSIQGKKTWERGFHILKNSCISPFVWLTLKVLKCKLQQLLPTPSFTRKMMTLRDSFTIGLRSVEVFTYINWLPRAYRFHITPEQGCFFNTTNRLWEGTSVFMILNALFIHCVELPCLLYSCSVQKNYF